MHPKTVFLLGAHGALLRFVVKTIKPGTHGTLLGLALHTPLAIGNATANAHQALLRVFVSA